MTMKFRLGLLILVLIILSSVLVVSAQTFVPDGEPYVIQADDTLWDLSREHGLTVDDILAANPSLNPYALPIGTEIIIPTANSLTFMTALKPTSPEPTPIPSMGTVEYTLQEGDTLWALTYRFDVTYEELLAANPDVNVYALPIGAVVNIPGQTLAAEPVVDSSAIELPETVQVLDVPVFRRT